MNKYIIPTVGMRGFYTLSPPLDQLVLTGEEYTCQAVRRLSDYLANNEDPEADIYKLYGLTSDDFKADLAEDMYIMSLQSDSGHWVYVPVRYLQAYPDANGVAYRTLMIGVSVGAHPVDKDMAHVKSEIEDLVVRLLGVKPVIKQVVTSKPVLMPLDKHEQLQAIRSAKSQSELTDGAKYRGLLRQYQSALDRVQALTKYIMELKRGNI